MILLLILLSLSLKFTLNKNTAESRPGYTLSCIAGDYNPTYGGYHPTYGGYEPFATLGQGSQGTRTTQRKPMRECVYVGKESRPAANTPAPAVSTQSPPRRSAPPPLAPE